MSTPLSDSIMAGNNTLSTKALWGDTDYSDATIVMGDMVWHVHRWVVCSHSEYFKKAYDGFFKESKEKSVDLTGGDFSQQAVHLMLKFMYTHELDLRQKSDALGTVVIADYFHVDLLRSMALEELKGILTNQITTGSFINYKMLALRILEEHGEGSGAEEVLVAVTASTLHKIINNQIVPGTWGEIVSQHPTFANKILMAMFPNKPDPAGTTGIKRPAGIAFDDAYAYRRTPGRGGLR